MRSTICRVCVLLAAPLVWGSLSNVHALGQVRMTVQAIPGEPFGVGRITAVVPKEALPDPLGAEGLGLTEKNGRVLFPAFNTPVFGAVAKEVLEATPLLTGGPVRQEVRGILRGLLDMPPRTTIYFLFRGDGPLELTLQARAPHTVSVVPRASPKAHRQMLEAWWSEYTAPPKLLQKKPEFPSLVENYLKATLARRLNLRLPQREQADSPRQLLAQELGLVMGAESILTALEQDRLLGLHNLGLAADQPLPAPLAPPELEIPEPPANVEVEPLARRVPAECFYVRFGSFSNFLWLQDTLTTWGGDLQNLVAARGLDYAMRKHMEEQLVLKTTALARLLGDTVVADVALIGTDTFFREGGAYGFLFLAKSNAAMAANIHGQRQERIKAGGATEKKIKIGQREVSYLFSPNGSVRSYYVADGDYHFVTTSRALVKRFLDTASGTSALGSAKEFCHARTIMPLERKDTVWIYLSDAFFRNLTGPHYRLEMTRRLQAQADIEIVQLAVLAAATEGKAGGSIEKLIAGGLLPPDFGPRPDGSQTVLEGGEVHDSLRGWRGLLLPVPDVPVTAATRAELTEYGKFADFYRENWGRMDPTIVGIKRQALPGNREQVVLDVRMTPLARKHFDLLSQLAGPPDNQQLATISGDMARAELVMPSSRGFIGFRDSAAPPLQAAGGRLLPGGGLREILLIYLGSSGGLPLPGFLDVSIILPPLPPSGSGARIGPFRQQTDQFTVFSLSPEVLAAVTPQLRLVDAPRPAQLRAWLGDPSQARITTLLNNWGYMRTRETSLGNLRLLNQLDQQLHVPPKTCQEAAEFILNAKLVCPIGGEYVYHQSQGEVGHWTTTALAGSGPRKLLTDQAPPGYQAPPLSWLRGLQLDATMTQKILSAHAEVIMQLPAKKEPPAKN